MMKTRMNLLYAVLVVVIIQLAVVVLLYEGIGSSSLVPSSYSNNLGAVEETGQQEQQHGAPLDMLPGKRAPRTILESEGKLRSRIDSTVRRHYQLPAAAAASNEVITTPTAKTAATSVSKQGKPLSAASSAAIRAKMLGRTSTNKTKKFVLETAIIAKPIVSSVPLHGPGAVSERPKYAPQHEKLREERLKPPSMLRDALGHEKLMEMNEDKMVRDMVKREQDRRAELLKEEQEEREERRLKDMEQKKRQEMLRSVKLQQQQKAAAKISQGKGKSPKEQRAARDALVKEYMEAHKEQARKLDNLWKEKKKTYIGGNVEHLHPPSSKEYFADVCAKTQEPLVECLSTPLRNLTALEASGSDIMFTMRTTMKYHGKRLPVLFDTWFSEIEPSSMFIVTDGEDEDLLWQTNSLGMHYVNLETVDKNHNHSEHSQNTAVGKSHERGDLCCKAGVELEQLLAPENKKFNWICHVDDDMYVNLNPLVSTLAHFDPRTESVYFGRSGTTLDEPRRIRDDSLIGRPGTRYHFAVGGMYCLSRTMLEEAKSYLVGCDAFRKTCSLTKEPEDVTVGLIIGTVFKRKLRWSNMIFTHGLDLLSGSPTMALKEQIAFSYGYGADGTWSIVPNVLYVPGGLYNIDEDYTQFRSLHCYLYPKVQWCMEKKQEVVERRRKQQNGKESKNFCECKWNKIICCEVYKENYQKYMQSKKKTEQKKEGCVEGKCTVGD